MRPTGPARSPFLVVVCGDGSNCGKTMVVEALIRALGADAPVGAMKISTATPDHLCARTGLACGCLRFEGRMRLHDDEAYTRRPGKDTERMHRAGAAPVLWLQSTSDFALEAFEASRSALAAADVWIVEGSSPIRAGRADFAIGVERPGREARRPKPEWVAVRPLLDVLLESRPNSGGRPLDQGGGGRPRRGVIDPEDFSLPAGLLDEIGALLAARSGA